MMNHLIDHEIEAYRNRELAPESFLAVSDHLSECDECHSRFVSGFSGGEAELTGAAYDVFSRELEIKQLAEEHLEYEQMASFVDGMLDPVKDRSVLVHLNSCGECARHVREMSELKTSMLEQVRPTRNAEAPKAPSRSGILSRLFGGSLAAQFGRPAFQMALALGSFALVLGVTLLILTTRLHSQVAGLESRVEQLQQENDSLKQEVASNRERPEGPNGPGGTDLAAAHSIQDGANRITIDSSGSVAGLEQVPESLRDAVRDAVASGRIALAAAPSVSIGQVSSTRGPAEEKTFEVSFPVSRVVESERPTFKWQALPGASSYTVFLKDTVADHEIEGEAVTGTSWTPEAALVRGHTYAWMVEAVVGDRRLRAPAPNKPFAAFKVLDRRAMQELKLAGDSHLVLGVAYAKAGLRDEAQRELQVLAAANPNSDMVRELLASLKRK